MDTTINTSINLVKDERRNYGIDLLRIIAMIMIPILHILGHGGVLDSTTQSSLDFYCYWFLEIFCYGAVNIFGIISGYVCVDSKFKLSNLFIIILRALFYSVIIGLIFYCSKIEPFSGEEFFHIFFPTVFEQWWYLTAYAAMFLFIPFINLAFNKIELKKMILLTFVIFVIFGCYISIFTIGENPKLLNGGYNSFWLLILYCFGALIKKASDKKVTLIKKNRFNLLISFGCACLTCLSLLIRGLTNRNYNYFVQYVSPTVVLSAIFLVIFMKNLDIKNRFAIKTITFFAPLCFSVYLIHDNILIRKHLINDTFTFLLNYNPFLSILIVIASALAIFISCCLVDTFREFIFRKTNLKQNLVKLENKLRNKIYAFIDTKILKN